MPPQASKVKENLITSLKEQIELGLTTSSCEAIHPNVRHPS